MMRTDESMRHFRHGRRRAGGAISRQTAREKLSMEHLRASVCTYLNCNRNLVPSVRRSLGMPMIPTPTTSQRLYHLPLSTTRKELSSMIVGILLEQFEPHLSRLYVES